MIDRLDGGVEAWEQNKHKYFQKSWSGLPFDNANWTSKYGGNKTFQLKA